MFKLWCEWGKKRKLAAYIICKRARLIRFSDALFHPCTGKWHNIRFKESYCWLDWSSNVLQENKIYRSEFNPSQCCVIFFTNLPSQYLNHACYYGREEQVELFHEEGRVTFSCCGTLRQKENRKFSFLITDPYFITYWVTKKKGCPHMALAWGGLVKLQRRNTGSNVTGLHSPKKHNG